MPHLWILLDNSYELPTRIHSRLDKSELLF